MASSATLSLLCSSFASHCKISSPSLNFSNLTSLSLSSSSSSSPSSHKLLSSSPRLAFPLLPKSSEIDSAVLEAELQAPEPVASESATAAASEETPKREEIFAVVMIGGRQYIVIPGRYIYTQRLKGAKVNDKVVLNKVLLVGTKTTTYIGKPLVTNAAIHAVVEEQGLNDKVVVFKYKKKKNYRRNIGHRQPNSRIRITAITGYQDYPAVTLES
ncbi:PREDICTED: 50S ribosomal protein L21, chloroplastic [Fragaria vesca subsp. vesca]|uniref:50S ribosomal protein L21, chloroplastic n=1 Tax=Fragaria vesca subsp. vesca TaxID=101020 RepID=UPI0002C35336|nr:PREDICTED: 50S ribosomal protein L21, chloroplastic [Fragaria vesca subsp. vesca]